MGLPTHDLVYFLGTSVQSSLLKTEEDEHALLKLWLDVFQSTSHASLPGHNSQNPRESGEFEKEGTYSDTSTEAEYDWETLWRHWELSILDWYRFMAGWGFWGNDRWVEKRAKEIIESGRVERLVDSD